MLTDGRKPGLDVLSFPAVNRGVVNHLDADKKIRTHIIDVSYAIVRNN